MIEPKIIKETSYGMNIYSIRDEMLSRREVVCAGEINSDTVNSLVNQILYLAHEDPQKEITLFINSPGGSVSHGLALYDVMKAVSCPIRTVCVGIAASMGAVLFAAGDKREMLPHARLMIHDPLIAKTGGSALQLKTISEDLLHTREILCAILAEHSGRSIDEIYEKTASDSYFYSEDAIKFGLADRIITEL